MKHRNPLGHFAFTIVCSGQAIFFKADGAKAVNAHHRRLSGDSAAGALLAPLLVVVAMIAVGWGVACMALFSLASCPKRMLQVNLSRGIPFSGAFLVLLRSPLGNNQVHRSIRRLKVLFV